MGSFRTAGVMAALGAALFALCLDAAAADLSVSAAINKAGRQRMLSQRIAKAYCQLGLGVMPEASTRQLKESLALFESQLGELKQFPAAKPVRDSVVALDKAWQPFKATAAGPVTRPGCEKLTRQSDELLAAAGALTARIQESAGVPAGRLVNMSGRQRMLAQRLAKLYMLRAWGFDSPALRDEMDSARNEFSGALGTLLAAPENTASLRRELDAVALQWEWFQNALSQDFAYASYRLVVADSSESMLSSLETVTGMYEELAPDR